MSFQIGAVGYGAHPDTSSIEFCLHSYRLNLTVANRVHIVEPQWNPSVEKQAIARALRMGQTQEVIIIRYAIEDTVEQARNCLLI